MKKKTWWCATVLFAIAGPSTAGLLDGPATITAEAGEALLAFLLTDAEKARYETAALNTAPWATHLRVADPACVAGGEDPANCNTITVPNPLSQEAHIDAVLAEILSQWLFNTERKVQAAAAQRQLDENRPGRVRPKHPTRE